MLHPYLPKINAATCCLLILWLVNPFIGSLQSTQMDWSVPKQIPGYVPSTNTPVLVTDASGMVYAFSAQSSIVSPSRPMSVFVNLWSEERGWTTSYDVILAPYKSVVNVSDAKIDSAGLMNIIFISGDNTSAYLYFSRSTLADAIDAGGWEKPIPIADSVNISGSAALEIDRHGNMHVLFSGYNNGQGVYYITSNDSGQTWSTPKPVFLANIPNLLVIDLHMISTVTGDLCAIWNVVNNAGQGRSIYFTRLMGNNQIWETPHEIANASTGYGLNAPTIIAYKDSLVALYILTPKIIMRRSLDNGTSWGAPVTIFTRHQGVNGTLAMVIDPTGTLHLFFGQRITGSPDIHGMWHSIWSDNYWSEPEAVVSGPRVMDGERSFDPFNARAIISQGKFVLVAWRTDPGNGTANENGVWYSYAPLNISGEQTITPPAVETSPVTLTPQPTTLPQGLPDLSPTQNVIGFSKITLADDVTLPLMVAIIPVILLISVYFYRRKMK